MTQRIPENFSTVDWSLVTNMGNTIPPRDPNDDEDEDSDCASKFALEALSECLAQEMKAFNVRVAIVEPGVIATPIFSKAKPSPDNSPYPHARRQRALFAKSLTNPTSPYVVGDKIREIVDGDSWQLRYPVGPDAVPFLNWRASKTDEEVVNLGAASDADFILMAKREFGLDVNL